MADGFRVALSGDFKKADGSPTYRLRCRALPPRLASDSVHRVAEPDRKPPAGEPDAHPLATAAPGSVPKSGRLGVIARFGVGYDTRRRCLQQAGIALVITPDGVRRPGRCRSSR